MRVLRALVPLGIALVITSGTALEVSTKERPQISDQARQQIEALMAEKAARTWPQRKISSRLLYTRKMWRGKAIAYGVQELRTGVQVEPDGTTLVDIRAEVTESVLAQMEALGATIINNFPEYQAVRARIPIDQVETLALLPQVAFIRPADEMMTHSHDPNADNVSEGDVAHRAAQARTSFGVDGTGITIGVISDGVNSLAARQATGDLPANVTVLPGQAGSGDEGTALLEIVHDLAPGANLLFATAFPSEAQLAANIQALRNAGADVIVDDVRFFAEPVFQDGIVAQAVNTVAADGAVYFSSAGNSGNLNDGTSGVWEGDFSPMAGPPVLGSVTAHDFGGGTNSNQITQDSPNFFILTWSDPQGGSSNDYDLFLLSSDLSTVFASSTNTQSGTQDPFESISSQSFNDLNNRLVVVRSSGADRFLHLNTTRGRLSIGTDGQTSGHNSAEGAFGVAAVNVATAAGGPFTGGAANPVETFSSDGPRRIFFEADGTPITAGIFSANGGTVRQKPDIAAADGVSAAIPGPFNPFFGTSAAAPHGAAIAALVLDTNPTLMPAQVRTALTSTALDIEAAGVDRDSGSGILDAFAAVGAVATPVISVTPDSLDFGSVQAGNSSDLTFTVENTGGGTLTGDATTSSPYTIVSGGSYNLTAGQTQDVTVEFGPTSAGDFAGTVDFTGAGGASRAVSGTGFGVNTITPDPVDLFNPPATLEITGGGFENFTFGASVINFTLGGTIGGTVLAQARALDFAGTATTLTVPFPDARNQVPGVFGPLPGLAVGDLTVEVWNQTGPCCSSWQLVGSVPLQVIDTTPPPSITPDPVDLGTPPATFTIDNLAGAQDVGFGLPVINFTVGGTIGGTVLAQARATAITSPITVPFPTAATQIPGLFPPLPGLRAGNLTVEVWNQTGPCCSSWQLVEGSIPLTVIDTRPAVIAVTPSSLAFGGVPVNSSANLTFTVQNTGGGTLTGDATTSSPYTIVSGGSYSLTADQTQIVTVEFGPTSAGDFAGSVDFTGGGGASRTVTGTGVGVNTITPNVIDLATPPATFTIEGGGFENLTFGASVINFTFGGTIGGTVLAQSRAENFTGTATTLTVPFPGPGTQVPGLFGPLPGLAAGTVTVEVWNQTGPCCGSWQLVGSISLTVNDTRPRARFLNNLVLCPCPPGTGFTATLTASEGFTWGSFSGVPSPYQIVTNTLSNFTAVLPGVATVFFPGTFNLQSGRNHTIVLTIIGGALGLGLIDDGPLTAEAPQVLGTPEQVLRGQVPEGEPAIQFAPLQDKMREPSVR